MPQAQQQRRSTVIDFATRNVFESSTNDVEECESAVRELVESFGPALLTNTLVRLGLSATNQGNESVTQALRAFCVLIIESDRPKLTAQLVGKLVKLELATGTRMHMRALGQPCGISKQAVSNRLKLYAARLNLPRPDSQPHTRQAHRLMNRRNYGNGKQPTVTPQRDATPTR